MPQLKSGRHVALSISPYIKAVSTGRNESRYFAMVALRLNAATSEALKRHLIIGHFKDNDAPAAESACFSTGLCVEDVLNGRSDWGAAEVEEFKLFLDEPRVQPWLTEQFDRLERAIRDNHIGAFGEVQGDQDSLEADLARIKKTVISASAMKPDAMQKLRTSELKP